MCCWRVGEWLGCHLLEMPLSEVSPQLLPQLSARLRRSCPAVASVEGSSFRGEQLEEVIDAEGGALLPGLHDHHIHLLSLAESLRSVDVSQVADLGQLRSRIRASADDAADRRTGESWIRAIGYHESAAGDLTKHDLDEIVRNRPLRIQHASGAMWMFNTLGMELLGISENHARCRT